MKARRVATFLLALGLIVAAARGSYARGAGEFHGGGWHGGGWHDGWHGAVIIGPGWGYPYPWYYPLPYPDPPPPWYVPEEPQAYVQPAPEAPPQGYWYFCPASRAYYPTVRDCAEPWVKVPPRAPVS